MSVVENLTSIARNYAWSWNPGWKALLVEAVGADWSGNVHPYAALASLSEAEADRLENNNDLAAAAADAADAVRSLESSSTGDRPDVAYLSPEFGISDTLPQYSGGLGILAGDHLKAASDLGTSLVGVGLFYANGYFNQGVDGGGQVVSYHTYRPADLGLSDTGKTVTVETPRGDITAQVWLAMVGRVKLFVLDARLESNDSWAQAVTDRLYGGDRQKRIDQEWLLGIGGYRALDALGITPRTIHLNEGHAGFSLLELLQRRMAEGDDLSQARRWVIDRTLFTTHTPVPAGIDRFAKTLLFPYLDKWAEGTNASAAEIWDLGLLPSDHAPNEFNMAAFCLRNAGLANGVSTLHGEVSRELFASLNEGRKITSVTNGVHARTWTIPAAQSFFDEHLGHGWDEGRTEAWARAAEVDTAAVAGLRSTGRRLLVESMAARGFTGLDPEALTIGFARRFATYKRAALLLRERDRLEALLADADRPVQFIFAGKAHPADTPGQSVLAEVVAFGAEPAAAGRFVFAPGYDMDVAADLYGGCDVWLNNPVRPQEACGTSGEKSALNGGINCSILDGWWAEWYDSANGWAIPTDDSENTEERDAAEADALLSLLEDQIVPLFYADRNRRPSAAWVDRIRSGWVHLGPKVTAARMVDEYDRRLYQPLTRGADTGGA